MPFEAGIGAVRSNFIRETVPGVTDADPDWLLYGDEMDMIGNWVPNTNLAARTAIGSPDVVGFSIGAEDHELSVAYKLQRWLTTAVEVPSDAIADGLLRDANGYLHNTHSHLSRQVLTNEGAQAGGDLRVYTYGTGGKFNTAKLSGDPGSSEPVLVEGTYKFEKVRSYAVSQPSGTTGFTIVSSDAGDTTQSVTAEDDGAALSETLALNGVTPVPSISVAFDSFDSFSLDLECVGDVTITFTAGAELITTIIGSESQQDIEGDLGLPELGSGSFEGALGTPLEHILGDTITKGGSPIDVNVMTMAIEVNNNIQSDAVTRAKLKVQNEGERNATANVTVFSASGSHQATVDHLKATASDIVWTMAGGTITLPDAVLTAPGPRSYEKGNATMQRDNVFTGQGLDISP